MGFGGFEIQPSLLFIYIVEESVLTVYLSTPMKGPAGSPPIEGMIGDSPIGKFGQYILIQCTKT